MPAPAGFRDGHCSETKGDTMGEGKNGGRSGWPVFQEKIFRMVSVGIIDVRINQFYDVLSTGMLIVNLAVTIMNTFDYLSGRYGDLFTAIEAVTVAFFAVDYVLRLLSARCLYPDVPERRAVGKYIFSFAGIVDLLSFLPYYLPFFFPAGTAAFRMFRVVRIMRLFRINAYYDSLNVITEVIVSKKQQLLSSVFILVVLMTASSLCMYSLEHNAQPEVFRNAFSGIWWSVSTLLTVGYGDIYAVTPLGRVFSIFITFLGVGMVAIPTGIISAGFVEQYQRLKKIGDYGAEEDIRFIRIILLGRDSWTGKMVQDLDLPRGVIIASIQRGSEVLVPRGNMILKAGDRLIVGAETSMNEQPVNLKKILLRKNHPWNGSAVRDLDISRQSLIVMIRRGNRTLIPDENLILSEGDSVYLYSKKKTVDIEEKEIRI